VEPDPPHSWTASHDAFAGGSNGGFVTALQASAGVDVDPRLVMAYQRRADLPISYALADGHRLCTRWFSSLMTSTWPNRLYFHAASSQGEKGNDFPPGGYVIPSIWDRLDEAGIEWASYYTDLPTIALFARPDWAERTRPIAEFFADVEAGTLPRVVMLDPGATFNDDHPPHHPLLGQLFIGSIYEALARSAYWERCLLALTYDEAGGFFDHVPPPLAADERASEGFDQLGFRVPSLVMSPWVAQGVTEELFDHTSPLATILRRNGLPHLSERDSAAQDFGLLLDEDRMERNDPLAPVALPTVMMTEEEIEAQCAAAPLRRSQPELHALVEEHAPKLSRVSEMGRIGRDLVDTAERFGLLKVT
jgi:phospholipase C